MRREVVGEAPVALEFNGLSYAVMMATPTDLADFATGFALCEGLVRTADEISGINAAEVENGWIVRATVAGLRVEALTRRLRARVSESSCGLCGIENLEAVARPLPRAAVQARLEPAAIFRALGDMRERQVLGRATGAAHAACWAALDGGVEVVREDVGRHNAMDKLIGGMARAGRALTPGFVMSSARCSYEIVEKAARGGAAALVTVSLPTDLALGRAKAAGLQLWVLARNDSVLDAV